MSISEILINLDSELLDDSQLDELEAIEEAGIE